VNVVRHNAPGNQPVALPVPEAQRLRHHLCDSWILEEAPPDSAIEVFFDPFLTVLCDEHFLGGSQACSYALCGRENSIPFDHFVEGLAWERVGEVKRDEIEAFLLFPVRQTAAIADSHFAELGPHGSLDE
jgi:hypothetical protein